MEDLNEYDIDFLGIDHLREMTFMAAEVCKHITSKKTFLIADFMSPHFKDEIRHLSR